MDFEDPFVFNHLDHSVSTEALPMVKITSLSNIWLPSYLLPIRGNHVTSNLNKPGIFRTLEKRTITDYFSVYPEHDPEDSKLNPEDNQSDHEDNNPNPEDDEPENCSEEDSCDEFSHADMLDILNDYSSPTKTGESFNNEKSNYPSEYQVTSSQLQSRSSYQESGNPLEANAFLVSQHEEYSPYEENGHSAKNQMGRDFSDTDKVTIVKTISDSLKDSLEEVYNSENEDATDCDAVSDHPSNTLSEQFARVEIGNLSHVNKTEEKQSGIQQSDNTIQSDCLKSLEDDFSLGTFQMDDAERVVEHLKYPIAYQKPVIEENVNKQKKQKGKKNKASREKKTLLVDALEKNSADYDEPEVDHFYEHVMRQERHKSYASEFPSLHQESKINYIDNTYTYERQMPESNWSVDADVTYEQPAGAASNEFEESVKFEHEDEDQNICTIVVENIPLGVTDTQLHGILLGFGELKNISMRQCGKYMKAKLRMDSICEVDWIIECLNGQQPFGTTMAPLKCYKL